MNDYRPRPQSKKFLDGDCPAGVLAIYDNGGKTFDRYTVFYREPTAGVTFSDMWIGYRGMSDHPFSPSGFGIYAEIEAWQLRGYRARAYRESCKWSSLPPDVKRAVLQDVAPQHPAVMRLEYLRMQIRAENISYGEIAELQDLAAYIDPGDSELAIWAGIPEFPEDAEDAPAYVEGMHVKLLQATPEYGAWATGYIERAYLGGAYDIRVRGHHLYRVTADKLAPLDTPEDTEG